ncbi:MAG: PilZ domain-containing protein, partial [Candidatus Omnitrophica bacterium]|nr:PilZ domain-containing protein [Candidatus Omnitrophota bacterium]
VFSEWLQGFTNNISRGGICLEINNLNPLLAEKIHSQEVRLSLVLEIPVSKDTVKARARIAWVRRMAGQNDRYLLGLSYEEISPLDNNRIMRYAWVKRLFVPVTLSLITILVAVFIINSYLNIKLTQGNKLLVEQLFNILQESSIAKQKLKEAAKEKDELVLDIQMLEQRIGRIEEEKGALENSLGKQKKARQEERESSQKIEELTAMIEQLSRDKSSLEEQLILVQHKENSVAEELLRLDRKKSNLEKANLDNMYKWLLIHQNQRTGLVMSFEGDEAIAGWAFIYDQSLAAQAYTNFGDFERARKIFDFFVKDAKKFQGFYYNAYYVNDGSTAEYIAHAGPNIWLGVAAMQYMNKTHDRRYLTLAEDIAAVMIDLQSEDGQGGLRGGPQVKWYSTEHNLDAYAFFDMLFKITQKEKYSQARDKTLEWLLAHTYDRPDIPIKRGKGDATIATDTYAWSIAAIGPEKLEARGMNPDRIMEFAEQNCAAEVSYRRPEGDNIKIKGFDFASQRNLARGGVVSSEWTAQMVLSFKIMADFYYKKDMVAKARAYTLKAEEYLAQLGNMIISSPSPSGQGESCMPYATQPLADTGHGWATPGGKATGSVSGTAYTIFAYYDYNPLELED